MSWEWYAHVPLKGLKINKAQIIYFLRERAREREEGEKDKVIERERGERKRQSDRDIFWGLEGTWQFEWGLQSTYYYFDQNCIHQGQDPHRGRERDHWEASRSNDEGREAKLETHHEERSWLKDEAISNIDCMSITCRQRCKMSCQNKYYNCMTHITLLVFQALRGWLNDTAERNIKDMSRSYSEHQQKKTVNITLFSLNLVFFFSVSHRICIPRVEWVVKGRRSQEHKGHVSHLARVPAAQRLVK